MKLTTVNIGSIEAHVVGIEGLTTAMIIDSFRPYMAGIERACAAYVAQHGEVKGFEIHVWPEGIDCEGNPIYGKMRLIRVLDEWRWPPEIKIKMETE
jgi:hypothetical protein